MVVGTAGFLNHLTTHFKSKRVSTILDMQTQKEKESEYKKVRPEQFWSITKWVVALLYKLEPKYLLIHTVSYTVMSMGDLVTTYVFSRIIDILIRLSNNPTAHISDLYPYIGFLVGYGLFNRIVNFITSWSGDCLYMNSQPKLNQSFYRKLNALGIQTLEQPGVSDRVYRTTEYLGNVYDYFENLVTIFSTFAQMVVSLIIVLRFFPLFTPLMILIALPYYLNDKRYRGIAYRFIFDHTHKTRMADLSASDLGSPLKLGEISITGAFGFLDKKYIDYRTWYQRKRVGIMKNWRSFNQGFAFLSDIAVYSGYVVVFSDLLKKVITVGEVTFRIGLLSRFQSSLNNMIRKVNDEMEMAVRLNEMYQLFLTDPVHKDGCVVVDRADKGPEIVMKNVSFSYPNSEKQIFNNLSLNIRSGEKVAIVGHNGAGKTTLVKLLCRIYRPSSGVTLANGVDLNNLVMESWYKNLGVLFQDYNNYPQLSVRDNIAIGKSDEPVDEVALRLAAQSADALQFIEEFPNKFDQILSEKFKGGIRPSTGQWQKLAIARFFYRNAPFVIFDEPTASIDAVSEYNIFNTIYDFFKGKTVIIISHRFSTVRNADRIIVLDHGEIVEEGSHNFLMSNNGYYAKAFNLQAKGYGNCED